MLSTAGALGVLPFALLRVIQQAWLAAVVDFVIILGFMILGTYVYRTRNVDAASIAVAVLCVGGTLATVYLIGPQQVYWAYPALMAVYYLIRPRAAIAFSIVMILALLPAILPSADSQATASIIITLLVTSAFAFAFSLISNSQREQLLRLATKDPLTGAGNRRALDAKVAEVVNTYKRSGTSASLILIDIDHFKAVNDAHGHAKGDQILKAITEIINLRIRVTDSLYRIGGEEFVVLLEGQDLQRAAHLAEQLRTLVDANELVENPSVTISLGVAEVKEGETATDWLHRADSALYRAKDAGRNSTSLSD